MLDVDDFIGKSFHDLERTASFSTSRPTVRQPLLVPATLVHPSLHQGEFKANTATTRRAGAGRYRIRLSATTTSRISTASGLIGHMDYGQEDPSLGGRSPTPLVHGGQRRQGLPERQAVRRMGHPARKGPAVGSSVSRGGDRHGPVGGPRRTVYSIEKYLDWLPISLRSGGHYLSEEGPSGAGQYAQHSSG